MRRNARNKNNVSEDVSTKIIKYASIGVGILAVIVIGLLMYSKSLNDEVKQGTLSSEQLASLVNKTSENTGNTESASTEMGKSVNEAMNELSNTTNTTNSTNNTANTTNTTNANNTSNSSKSSTNALTTATKENTTKQQSQNTTSTTNTTSNSKNSTNNNANQTKNTEQSTTNQELNFAKPVEGEIVKEFAKDNLLYSATLQEWTVHTGVDISAEKTTVVKAAEAGTVKSIKNDPRYGLTIVVEHANGFETVYSNLLSSEFVVEGEKVEKGQSLGTVGNTAAFEIADESHLHFEILKDSIQVDPSIYFK